MGLLTTANHSKIYLQGCRTCCQHLTGDACLSRAQQGLDIGTLPFQGPVMLLSGVPL